MKYRILKRTHTIGQSVWYHVQEMEEADAYPFWTLVGNCLTTDEAQAREWMKKLRESKSSCIEEILE